MIKLTDLVAVGVATAVLTLGLAAAQARDVKPALAEQTATSGPSVAPEARTELGQATAEKIVVEAAPCAKKVKVVYAGYGEADRACASH